MSQFGKFIGTVNIFVPNRVLQVRSLLQSKNTKIPKSTNGNSNGASPKRTKKRKHNLYSTRNAIAPLRNRVVSDNLLFPVENSGKEALSPTARQQYATSPLFKIEDPNDPIILIRDGNHVRAQPASETSTELLRIKATWPFDFFPSELIVEEKKVIVNNRMFFWDNTVTTIVVYNIAFTEITNSLFFASLTLHDNFGVINPSINWLKRKDAVMAKELIDGLIMKEKAKIEVQEFDTAKRVRILRQLGETVTTS